MPTPTHSSTNAGPRDATRPVREDLPNGYWLTPFPIFGSEFPGWTDATGAAARLGACLDAGITVFIDLREDPHHLGEYDDLLAVEAEYRGTTLSYHRFPLPDGEAPESPEALRQIIERIDAALAEGRSVCVHCLAGIGRTGMVLAAFLTTRGWTAAAAMALVQQRYWETRLGGALWLASPQLPEQRAYVARLAARRDHPADGPIPPVSTPDTGTPPDPEAHDERR